MRLLRAIKDWYLAFCLAVVSGVHFLPFWRYGANPLGYDTGFYRRYLTQPFVSFPNTPVPGLGTDAPLPRALLDALRLFHLSPDVALYGSYIVCFALLPVLLFYLLRPSAGRRAAFCAGILIAFSAVSYNAYWYMLWKSAFAIDLILLAFICIDKRRWYWMLLLDAAIALSHETSAIVYLATLGVYFLIQNDSRRQVFAHGCATLACFLAVNIPSVREASVALPSAIFLEWQDYLALSSAFFLLIICALPALFTIRPARIVLAFAVAAFAFPVLHLPFYQRIFVYTDIALAAYAGCAAAYLIAYLVRPGWRMFFAVAALCTATGLLFGNFFNQVSSLPPLMSQDSINDISAIGTMLPPDSYLLTTSSEAPWYEGWTQAHITAPGLLHDTHNFEEWTAVWDSTSSAPTQQLLSDFPEPLYISTFGALNDLIGQVPVCVTPIAADLWKDECGK